MSLQRQATLWRGFECTSDISYVLCILIVKYLYIFLGSLSFFKDTQVKVKIFRVTLAEILFSEELGWLQENFESSGISL